MAGVSHSRVEAYISCRRKEFYSYGRKLTRVETSTGLALGSAGHEVLETLYRAVLTLGGNSLAGQKKVYPEAVQAARAKLDEIYDNGFEDTDKRAPLRTIIEKYLQREPFIDNEWKDDSRQWRIMAVEKEFNLQYDDETEAQYPFVIDLIVQDPDKRVVVVDHKFLYDFYGFEETNLMPQIPKYIGALRALGHKVTYGMYNMLRTRPEGKGNKLKKDELVKLLYNFFGEDEPPEAMKAWGEDLPKMKVADLEKLAEAQNLSYYEGRLIEDWALAMPIEPSGQRIQRSFLEQITASQEVAELDTLEEEERDIKAIRVGNKMICQSCSFKDLCTEELRGGNVALLLQTDYKIKEKREKIEVSDEVES